MTKEHLEKLMEQLSEKEHRLSKEKKHLQELLEINHTISKGSVSLLEEVHNLFNKSPDRNYYQQLLDRQQSGSRNIKRAIQDKMDDFAQRQYQLRKEQDNLKSQLKDKGGR